ncbi:MAG: hypothetical protein ABJC89_23820, partial [Acidobacteriota bacterium]
MKQLKDYPGVGLSRRSALGLMGTGLGALTALRTDFWPQPVSAQGFGVQAVPPAPDPRFPKPPTWETEFKEIAPNVYAYIQAGGPGKDNVSISNGGVIVGDDGVMIIDSLAAPMHAKRFVAAIRKIT